ncbi:MAG: caspase family protein [Thermoplasmata archaeon]|nr:MAG: caspase family protein [Thermoplasmata archaeon]
MRKTEIPESDVSWIIIDDNGPKQHKFCKFCCARIRVNAGFCSQCGRKQTQEGLTYEHYEPVHYHWEPQPVYPSPSQSAQPGNYGAYSNRKAVKRGTKSPWYMMIGVVAVFALIGMAAFAYGQWSEPPKEVEPEPEEPQDRSKYAIVVGISDYLYVNDLRYADNDARDWSAYLENQGYEVYTLTDKEATGYEINRTIAMVGEKEQEGDYVAFVFSGHGGSNSGHSYLCPSDSSKYTWTKDIKDTKLAQWFSGYDSHHMFFFFDTCSSGGLDEVSGPGRYVSQTCRYSESGIDDGKYRNGLWTRWFLEWGLEGEGYEDLETCYQNAYPMAVNDAADSGLTMHPEEEDGNPNSPFRL